MNVQVEVESIAEKAAESGPVPREIRREDSARHAEIRHYYRQTGEDYAAWSPDYNMHFGYWRRGLKPWRLEPMLEEMTWQVMERLGLEESQHPLVADLGCGVAASARGMAKQWAGWRFAAFTLVPWQIERGRKLAARDGVRSRIGFRQADYCATGFAEESVDAAYAIESACHAPGADKDALLAEAARLLKPGGRLLVADLFRKHERAMTPWFRWVYRTVCRKWMVEDFAAIEPFRASLRRNGFTDIRVEDISYRVAPSAAHVPRVTAGFLWRELRRSGLRMGPARWGHVLACVLGPLLGVARWRFAYCLVSARKA